MPYRIGKELKNQILIAIVDSDSDYVAIDTIEFYAGNFIDYRKLLDADIVETVFRTRNITYIN